MVSLNLIELPLAQQVPVQGLPEDQYLALNDLYLQLHNLVRLLNAGGLVLQSANGHYWTPTISNAGVLTWTDVGTVRP